MLLVDFIPRQVIGVMPRGFRVAKVAPDILLPQRFAVSGTVQELSYSGIARLKPGVTIALANQDVARVWSFLSETANGRSIKTLRIQPNLRPLKKDVVGDIGPMLTLLMGALCVSLLLVCANVANLVLLRTQSRGQELAIRAALGAGWGRIAHEILVESLTLGFVGGALGLAFRDRALIHQRRQGRKSQRGRCPNAKHADRGARRYISAAQNLGNLMPEFHLIVCDMSALTHQVHAQLEGRQDALTGRRNVGPKHRSFIAGSNQF